MTFVKWERRENNDANGERSFSVEVVEGSTASRQSESRASFVMKLFRDAV